METDAGQPVKLSHVLVCPHPCLPACPALALCCSYRLFAVGYAARQVSCRSQLELLLSNPPAAPGLAIAPADWLAVGGEDVTCAQCDAKVSGQQVGVAWDWDRIQLGKLHLL